MLSIAVLLLIYSGFVVPTPCMRPWLEWFHYVPPTAYAFESLLVNKGCDSLRLCSAPVCQMREKGDNPSESVYEWSVSILSLPLRRLSASEATDYN